MAVREWSPVPGLGPGPAGRRSVARSKQGPPWEWRALRLDAMLRGGRGASRARGGQLARGQSGNNRTVDKFLGGRWRGTIAAPVDSLFIAMDWRRR